RRLHTLLLWSDERRNTFAIQRIPANDWGMEAAFEDRSNVLCLAGTSKPIDLWIVGEIVRQWWVDGEGMPATRPAISVQPLPDSQRAFCKTFLNERCMPANTSNVANQFGPSQVKASRWMNTRAEKDSPSKTLEFKEVYDARTSLRDKSHLAKLNVGQLKVHDIVVLEIRLGRYAAKQEGDKTKKKGMERWQAFFDLQAV
ncbi:hypothetical protein B0H16DRAFT_1216499, partial [Mycena metata]